MDDDFGLICPDCGCVTIFQAGSSYPRRCHRCDTILRERPSQSVRRWIFVPPRHVEPVEAR